MNCYQSKIWLCLEFVFLFAGIPLFLLFGPKLLHPSSLLLPLLVGIFLLLKHTTSFRFKELFYIKLSKILIKKHLLIILTISIILLIGQLVLIPEKLLNLPKANLKIWLAICVFYPLFSAFTQEIIYRSFLFHRYKKLFHTNIGFILISGFTFSFVHILYYSPVSLILSFFAGVYLSKTYLETKSVLFTSILHGILGNIVFTIGLGEYFWLDMINYL